ncbi:MAG: lamin tail domain-containing protein [Verrucomicrobiia bacterium]
MKVQSILKGFPRVCGILLLGIISVFKVNAQYATAGTLYVDLRATDLSGGTGVWQNRGTLTGNFTSFGNPTFIVDVLGTEIPGVYFSGSDAYVGPQPPADLTGGSDRSVEVWALNPSLATEETLVAWSRRGSVRQNFVVNYGSSLSWGAAAHWDDDIGWPSSAAIPQTGQWHYFVYTYDGNLTAKVYVDGVLVVTKTLGGVLNTFTGYPIDIAAQRSTDGNSLTLFLSGYINSVRIHGGVLTPEQIASNYLAGPVKMVQTGPVQILSQPQSISVSEFSSAIFNIQATGEKPIYYQWFKNNMPLSGETNSSLVLPSVLWADNGAQFYAVVSNFYQGAPYAVTSSVVVLNVQSVADSLVHRYSFNNGVQDLVGNAHGTLMGGATVSGGELVLNGTSGYLDLPNNLFTNLTSVTFEAWVTDLGSGNWARIYDFGNSTAGEGAAGTGTQYMFLSLPSGNGNLRGAYTITGGGSGEQIVEWVGGRPAVGEKAHIVWTSDGNTKVGKLYVNGVLVGQNNAMTLTPASIGPTLNNWIGRSQWSADAFFNGRIDEFRIYNQALSEGTILRNFRNGPDMPPMNGPIFFVQHPTNQVVDEGKQVSFSVDVNGSIPWWIQWFKNDHPVPSATNLTFSFTASATDNGATIYAVATNRYTNVVFTSVSSNATLTVIVDNIPPSVLIAQSISTNGIKIIFSEPVKEADATNNANYSIVGSSGTINIQGITISQDKTQVSIATTPLVSGASYTITVSGIRDLAASANTLTTTNITFIATAFTVYDINGSQPSGFVVAEPGGFKVGGGGSGFGGASDQFSGSFELKNGDFDVQIRVNGISAGDLWAKVGLMARETTLPGSKFAAVIATPSVVGVSFEYRATNNTSSALLGNLPPNYPYCWLRLKRQGTTFTGYSSFDGNVWIKLGQKDIPMNDPLYVGLVITSHTNGVISTTTVSDYNTPISNLEGTMKDNYEPPGPSTRRTGLTFSEIMYRPKPRSDGKNLEFIEIYNSNPWFHDIGLHKISGDIDYTFPPGTKIGGNSFIVIAANPAAIEEVYGIHGVYGPYTNTLKTSGTIRLQDEQGTILLEVKYSNKHPWPMGADGTGHSIVLARPSYGESDPRAWGLSEVVGGTPGGFNIQRPSPLQDIVINELLAHSVGTVNEDFVELYNHGNFTNDLSGCILTDNPSSNKFVIPQGTLIMPRGYLVFNQSQLGFGLKAGGDTIYLKSPDGERVIDTIRFDAQLEGYSYGRYPDGANDFYVLKELTPAAPNTGIYVSDIVINEIMYHPISGNDDDQYVELYNQSTNTYNLSGWRFVDGIDFVFPENTVIPPNGYLVVAKNVNNLLSKYTQLNSSNTVGNFNGSLSHKGERVALARPVYTYSTNQNGSVITNINYAVVDEVTYADGGRWGEWADGGGSSLELIDPRSNHRLAFNWANSDETSKSEWTTIEATGVLDNGANYASGTISFAQVGLLEAGECLVDDLEIIPYGTTQNYVANSGFESGLVNWSLLGCFNRSNLEPGKGINGSNALRLRTRDRIFTLANSAQCSLTNTSLSAGQTVTMRLKARWLRGCPEILFRLHGAWFEATGPMKVPKNLGTPGLPNSRAVTNAPPAIYAVKHYPALPSAGEDCRVFAMTDDSDGVQSLYLNYRIDPNAAYTQVQMVDDGTGGDLVAGDGIYTALIPGQSAGTTVAFYVSAIDNYGAASRFPEILDDNGPVRECVVRFGEPNPPSAFGAYHLWLTQSNRTRWINLPVLSNENIDGTLVYNNRIIYNMDARYAGSPYHQAFDAPDGNNACHYYWSMPKDDKLLGHTSFNKIHWIGNDIQDDNANANINDSTLQREQAANTLLRSLGLPWIYRRYVIVYVNGVRRGQLMEDALRPSVSVPDAYFPNEKDGFLFKLQPWFEGGAAMQSGGYWPWENKSWCLFMPYTTTGGAYKLSRYRWNYQMRQTPDSQNNYTNFYTLMTIATNYNQPNYAELMENVADMDNWLRLVAANHAAGNWDCWGVNNEQNVYAYVSSKTRWKLFMFDFSIVLGNRIAWSPGSNLETINSGDVTWQRIYGPNGNPKFRRKYWAALKELTKTGLKNEVIDPILDAKYAAFLANKIVADSPDVIKTWISSARSSIASQVAARDTQSFALSTNTITTTSSVVTVTGVAPLEVESILVDGAIRPVTWNNTVTFNLSFPNKPGTNVYSIVGIDRNGNVVGASTQQLTVVNLLQQQDAPENKVIINEIMYNPPAPELEFVEIYNTSSTTAFDMSGWRINGLGYTFPSGSWIKPNGFIVLARSRTAFANYYGALIPVFDVFTGNLQKNGETLTLVRPGNNGEEIIVNRVRYDNNLPWPQMANGNGASLQVIDATRDNSRVCNWSDPSGGWRLFTITGQPNGYRLIFYLDSANTIYIDDLSLIVNGTNMIKNGDFESGPLTNFWKFQGTNGVKSDISTDVKRSGNGSLRLTFNPAGGPSSYIYYDFAAANVTNVCTFSFWYKTGTNTGNLQWRISGTFRGAIPVQPPTPFTPGQTNSVASSLPQLPLVWLNEVQPAGTKGLTNELGEPAGWVELYNSGDSPIDLSNYYLANNYTNITQWKFPEGTVIGSKEFLFVWLDGHTELNSASQLHANFSIPQGTGSIALIMPINSIPSVLDYLNYSDLQDGYSYGDYPDGQPFYRQSFYYATPSITNNPAKEPVVVFINEWMASNTRTIANPVTGAFDDWFELYNPGNSAVDLSGYYLTDDATNKFKYRIPNGYYVPAKGFLVIWADNTPSLNRPELNELHVNFRLSKNGSDIALFTPDGWLIDMVTFGVQTSDATEGRYPDGAAFITQLSMPTPGTPNKISGVETNTPPVIQPVSDKFIVLGQTLRFTINASDYDFPAQTLTYSLEGTIPQGAQVNNSGEFVWTPSQQQAASTNVITVRVTDSGNPPASATVTFKVIVGLPPKLVPGGIAVANGQVRITIQSLPGKSYRIEYKTSLSETSWTPVGNPVVPVDPVWTFTDSIVNGNSQRFYRIVVLGE